jgi:hypothetical protein
MLGGKGGRKLWHDVDGNTADAAASKSTSPGVVLRRVSKNLEQGRSNPPLASIEAEMAKLDTEQINENRRTVEENLLDDSTQPAAADCDDNWPDAVYRNMPADRVGFLPENARGKR